VAPTRIDTVSPTQEATDDFNAQMQAAMPKHRVDDWFAPVWYLGPDGNPELWPWNPREHRIRLSKVIPARTICGSMSPTLRKTTSAGTPSTRTAIGATAGSAGRAAGQLANPAQHHRAAAHRE